VLARGDDLPEPPDALPRGAASVARVRTG